MQPTARSAAGRTTSIEAPDANAASSSDACTSIARIAALASVSRNASTRRVLRSAPATAKKSRAGIGSNL